MALATYSDLKASVAQWLNRNDLTDVIPDFVRLCESTLNERLRCPHNEAMNTDFVITGRYTSLPVDFAEMRRVFLNDSMRTEMVPLPQSGRVEESGIPAYYNIVNNTLELVPLSTSYTLEITYWKVVPPLETNDTSDILTNHPELYLYGTCLQGAYFLDDAQMVAKFEPKFQQAILAANSRRFRQMGTGLQVRVS